MEFFRKNGKFVELGGFGASFIFMFMPFLTATIFGYSASVNLMEKPTTAWGIFCLIFILCGIALTVIKYFKPELLDKLGNAKQVVVDYGVLGVASLTLLFVLIAGFSNLEQYVHLGVGFYLMFLALGAVIASCVIQKFVLKDNGPVAPLPPQPVMGGQVMPQQPVNPVPVQPQQVPQQPVMNQPVGQPTNNQQPPINPNQQ